MALDEKTGINTMNTKNLYFCKTNALSRLKVEIGPKDGKCREKRTSLGC